MRRFEQTLLKLVLRRVASRVCLSTVPRSGRAGEGINCFNTTLLNNGEPDVVILRFDGDAVEGLRHDGNSYSVDVRIPLSQVDPATLHVTHFYGLDEVRYEGTWSVARGLWIGWPYAWLHANRLWNALAQRLFNRRSLPARRRLDLLREVFEASAASDSAVDALDLMSNRHGYRWAGHPAWQSHHGQMERQLELLVDAGDLRKSGTGYQSTGQGLKTLDDSDEADRRHKENFRLQVGLGILALASALMAAAQAGLIRLPLLLDMAPTGAASAPTPASNKPSETPFMPQQCLARTLQPATASQPTSRPAMAPSSVKPAVANGQ